jgi:oxygen-independent coproporphyrinogen III oxidase
VEPLAIYVHVPFCPSKCGYCDFNSYAMQGDIVGRTTEAMLRQIAESPWRGRPSKTIFFGGGTPTYIPTEQLIAILKAIVEAHPPIEGAEVTSEANPGTVDASKFEAMRQAGFNRLSLGAQSFQESDLITLGRVHASDHITKAVEAAREAGFDNLNLDLMFGLPGQSPRAWEENMERALALRPEHLSLYCLTIEPSTAFYKLAHQGKLDLPGEDAQVEMYDRCAERLLEAGYGQYEISNYAKPGRECQHNLAYWRNEEYAGYGPGAVGRMGNRRTTGWKHPERFCEAAIAAGDFDRWFCEFEALSAEAQEIERIMLGLRLNEGVEVPQANRLESLKARGWIEAFQGRVVLTKLGRHFCTEATLELI